MPARVRDYLRSLRSTALPIAVILGLNHLALHRGLTWDAIGLAMWPLLALLDRWGKSASARRMTARAAERERRWAAAGRRPLWADSFRLSLIAFPLIALVFLGFAVETGRTAHAVAKLPDCGPAVTARCISTRQGVLIGRHVDGSQQEIDVVYGLKPERIFLSSDGWGGDWRGHFPIGETVRVRYDGTTPLQVIEPNGHRRATADAPSGISGFLWFMGWFFLGATLPAAFVLRGMQRRRSRLLAAAT